MSHFIDWKDLSDKASGLVEKQILLPLVPALLVVGIFYYFWSEYENNLVGNTKKLVTNKSEARSRKHEAV